MALTWRPKYYDAARDRYQEIPNLTWRTITGPSRLMLPAYIAQATAIGGIYTLNPMHRLDGVPSLTVPKTIMGGHMWPWGLLFLVMAALMVAAFHSQRRSLMVYALFADAATTGMWAILYAASVPVDPHASLVAPIWTAMTSVACLASARSLLHTGT